MVPWRCMILLGGTAQHRAGRGWCVRSVVSHLVDLPRAGAEPWNANGGPCGSMQRPAECEKGFFTLMMMIAIKVGLLGTRPHRRGTNARLHTGRHVVTQGVMSIRDGLDATK